MSATYFHMSQDLFNKWTYALIDEAYDWKQLGLSNEYCNDISMPKYGLRLINWQDRSFYIIDEKKYAIFLLRYQ
jgi:hypothetical protein